MTINIHEINKENLHHINQCDATFKVDSKLVLSAENGVIHYSVVSVEPYQKRYVFEEQDFPSYISNPNKTVYLAYVDGHLAGQIGVVKHWNAYAWIDDFAVDVHFRRRGIGLAMMQRGVDWAKDRHLPGLMLETQNNNVAACKLYESCGFELRGFDVNLYKALNPSTDEIALYWYLIF